MPPKRILTRSNAANGPSPCFQLHIIGSSIKKLADACGPTRAGLGKVVNIRRDIKLGPIILRPTPCLFLLLEMEFFIRRVGLGFYLHC